MASRKAALVRLHMEHSERQLHLQGNVAAARQAADAARFNAEKQRQEQQQQAGEAPLPRSERDRLACAVLQLHHQQTRTGAAGGGAAALSDGPKPLDNETLAKLMPGIMSGAFWLSHLGEGARLVYYWCSK